MIPTASPPKDGGGRRSLHHLGAAARGMWSSRITCHHAEESSHMRRTMTRSRLAVLIALVVGGTGLSTLPAAAVAADGSAPVDRRALQAALDQMTQRDGLPGAQAVVAERGRTTIMSSGFGDLESRRPMPGPDGHLRMGSNVKTMVSTVVLQLLEEGKVSLDAPLSTYLPAVVPTAAGDAEKIKLRHLLQHTSGLHNYTDDVPAASRFQPFEHYTRQRLLKIGFSKKPNFEPGTNWSYSNTGYVLLGMVIEKVTGHPWQEEVAKRVFARAGMRHSYFPGEYEYGVRRPHARGYMQVKGADGKIKTADVTEWDPSQADANGAGVSTPDDLNRFYTALLGGRLLKKATLTRMKTVMPVPNPQMKLAYGLGLGRYTLPCGGYAWGNGGNIEGFQTLTGVIIDERGRITRTATVATNTTFTDANVNGGADHLKALYTALCTHSRDSAG
ncbi:serine hydrolase domain-containing protein [Nonomuraea sp. NPDC000554]|uniref:serine hydrolase domain-containing protein n=1 Tax=Nonomuraea sp. NPDC000554 TaxID=3154259 RepID=UPI0033225915